MCMKGHIRTDIHIIKKIYMYKKMCIYIYIYIIYIYIYVHIE